MDINFKPIGVIHTHATDIEVKEDGDRAGEI